MAEDPLRITIHHTNDMHGRIEAMARLSAMARSLREEAEAAGRRVFFWDAGDALDRLFRPCSLSKGAAMARVLNAMGYELMTMGNDISLTYGPPAMVDLAARLSFPVLAANARDGDGPLLSGLRESLLLRLGDGAVLGIFGLTAPWGDAYSSFGLHLPDELATARRVVDGLRVDGATVVIALSHLGFDDDRRMAEAVPGIDLIIGGHSHTKLEHGLELGTTLIVQTGQFAEALGVINLDLDPRTGRVLRMQARLEAVPADTSPDPSVLAALAEAESEAEALAAAQIGTSQVELSLDYGGECPLGDMAADSLRERVEAEAAILISGHFRKGLPSGVVTFGDLDDCTFSTANPQRTRVRGAQIRKALERGLDPKLTGMKPSWARGAPVGHVQISGLTVEYDPGSEVGHRVLRVLVGDQPLGPDGTYLLAHTDAETAGGLDLLTIEPGQETYTEVPTILREVLAGYLRSHSPLPSPFQGRWRRAAARRGP
jgi:2',3'-cyclic-nucleotide 2'-phosphodiesterase (5'-nucleotidase family)